MAPILFIFEVRFSFIRFVCEICVCVCVCCAVAPLGPFSSVGKLNEKEGKVYLTRDSQHEYRPPCLAHTHTASLDLYSQRSLVKPLVKMSQT